MAMWSRQRQVITLVIAVSLYHSIAERLREHYIVWLASVQLRNILGGNKIESSVVMAIVTQAVRNNCEYKNLLYLCDNWNCLGTHERSCCYVNLPSGLTLYQSLTEYLYPCGFCDLRVNWLMLWCMLIVVPQIMSFHSIWLIHWPYIQLRPVLAV